MFEIQTPFSMKGIPLKPELSGRQKVDETIIQTLAAIMGFDGEARRLITCALGGSLNTVGPPLAEIINVLSTGAGELVSFADTPTTEVLVKAGVNNVSPVWVNVWADAGADVGWRLMPTDWVKFPINNMRALHLKIVASGDRLEILRSE